MPAKVNKAVVTNVSALKAKYGNDGWNQIKAALDALVAADGKRGLNTAVVALDNAAALGKYGGKPVAAAADPKQNKAAIDAVYTALVPDYVMILGAVDVVPHQDLVNPAAGDGGDPDPTAFGDLPYACEKPYSQTIEDFTAVTRAVGRLPDVTGANDPAYLVGLLQVAAGYTQRPASDYTGYLGMTAAVWEGSTAMSLRNIFGNSDALQLVPPKGPQWTPAALGARMHFVNCHGAPADTHYYGQSGGDYPIAHDAKLVAATGLSEGTVIAAECCYGAELFDPKSTQGQLGMVNTYLAGKAYGFLGSSTVAYGPADTNGSADLLCQYFLKHVLAGASLGRAALQARQEFVTHAPVLDPFDLKTLGQFSLMGDPSIQPVQVPQAFTVLQKGMPVASDAASAFGRGVRRDLLRARGLALSSIASTVDSSSKRKTPAKLQALLQSEVDKALAQVKAPSTPAQFSSFDVLAPRPPAGAVARKAMGMAVAPSPGAVHIAVVNLTPGAGGPGAAGVSAVPKLVAVVAIDRGGTLVSRRLFSH